MQHGCRHRVGTEGQSTDGFVLPIARHLTHDVSHQRGGDGIQSHPAQVDVIVGLATAREYDLSVHHRLINDLLPKRGPRDCRRHAFTLDSRAYC